MQVLTTWVFAVVPSSLSLMGLEMSLDMRLLVVLDETPGSDGSESMAVAGGLEPTWLKQGYGPSQYSRVCHPSLGWPELPAADSRGADPAPGAGRLLAGSIKLPELASSLALHLPASCWEAVAPLPDVVLRLPAGNAGFFL